MISFYCHTPLPENLNERRALCHAARLLHKHQALTGQHLTFIANISPDHDFKLAARQLPQLDALLLGQNFVAILELKSYFDPIEAKHLNGRWYAVGKRARQPVLGGTHKNPYLQAKHTRPLWVAYLAELMPAITAEAWHHLQTFILFDPYLHPRSTINIPGTERKWLQFHSIGALPELIYSSPSEQLGLTNEAQHLLVDALGARPWDEIDHFLDTLTGYIHVLEPGQPLLRYPLPLWAEWTLGRSRSQPHHIRLRHARVSSTHLQLIAQRGGIKVVDLVSKNGTFLVDGETKTALQEGWLTDSQRLLLGGRDPQTAVQLWFEPLAVEGTPSSTQKTL